MWSEISCSKKKTAFLPLNVYILFYHFALSQADNRTIMKHISSQVELLVINQRTMFRQGTISRLFIVESLCVIEIILVIILAKVGKNRKHLVKRYKPLMPLPETILVIAGLITSTLGLRMQTLDLIADSPAHTLGISAHSGSPYKIDIKTNQPNTISLIFDDMVMKGLDKVVVSMAAEDPYYVFYSNNYPDGLFFATYPSPVTVLATSLSPVTDPLTFTLAAQISYAPASYNHPPCNWNHSAQTNASGFDVFLPQYPPRLGLCAHIFPFHEERVTWGSMNITWGTLKVRNTIPLVSKVQLEQLATIIYNHRVFALKHKNNNMK